MMAAPFSFSMPPQPLFATSPSLAPPHSTSTTPEDQLRAAASRFSPASTASDSARSWASMNPNGATPARASTSPRDNESGGNGLLFITGNNPEAFRDKAVMTKVRKKAMGSFLEKRPKHAVRGDSAQKVNQVSRSRLQSEDSTGSRGSVGSDQGEDIISNSEALKILRGESRRPRRRSSSPTRSPTSSNVDQQAPSPGSQISLRPTSFDMALLPPAPIVIPSRVGITLPYDAFTVHPFKSIGKPLDPFRAMFQVQHPRVSVEELKFHCSRSFGTRAMGRLWIPTLTKSPHAFLSTLCIASAHLDAINDTALDSVQTTALRQEVIYMTGQSLLNPQTATDDYTIIALTQLICSEIISGDETVLGYHEGGAEKMVISRGGLNKLGVDGRLAPVLSWVSLESAILRESKPRKIYVDCCTAIPKRNYPNTATIPESPLWCPRNDFDTIRRSPRCSTRSMELLKDIRMMIDLFLHETTNRRQNEPSLKNLYKKITRTYTSVTELQHDNILTATDWTYEAIRIAAVIQATAIIKRLSLSEALKSAAQLHIQTPSGSVPTPTTTASSSISLISPTNTRHDSPVTNFSTSPSFVTSPVFDARYPAFPISTQSFSSSSSFFPAPQRPSSSPSSSLLASLKAALSHSDLSDCWSDMAGVLLWISLTCAAASRRSDKDLKKWTSALSVRCSILLCFEHMDAVCGTLLRMSEFVEGVGFRGGEEVVRREGQNLRGEGSGSGKRRRV